MLTVLCASVRADLGPRPRRGALYGVRTNKVGVIWVFDVAVKY